MTLLNKYWNVETNSLKDSTPRNIAELVPILMSRDNKTRISYANVRHSQKRPTDVREITPKQLSQIRLINFDRFFNMLKYDTGDIITEDMYWAYCG